MTVGVVEVPGWMVEAARLAGMDLQAEYDMRARAMGYSGVRLEFLDDGYPRSMTEHDRDDLTPDPDPTPAVRRVDAGPVCPHPDNPQLPAGVIPAGGPWPSELTRDEDARAAERAEAKQVAEDAEAARADL